MADIKRISFLVSGLVQGVFFRAFTNQVANRLAISGWVRNTPDDRVAGEAQGSDANISDFVAALNKGSPGSQVERVEVGDLTVVEGETGFEVRK